MCSKNNLMLIDEANVENLRKDLSLPRPEEFENGLITVNLLESLKPLLELDFPKGSDNSNDYANYDAITIDPKLMENRLRYVIGISHIDIDYIILDTYESLEINTKNEEYTNYHTEGKVVLSIGNTKEWINKETGEPSSKFVPIMKVSDLAYGKNVEKGSSKKTAKTDGIKRCLRRLGISKYIYHEENGKGNSQGNEYTFKLLSSVTINESNKLMGKIKVGNLDNGDTGYLLLWKDSTSSSALKVIKELKRDDKVKVNCLKKDHKGELQYFAANSAEKF